MFKRTLKHGLRLNNLELVVVWLGYFGNLTKPKNL